MIFRKNLFFTIARIVSVFFMGLVVALFIALSQVNLETLRGNVLHILRDATGLDIEIQGTVSWKFSLRPQIQLQQVRVRNAQWAKHEYAFSAESVDVTLDLLSLMQDLPTIKNIKINDASVCIEKNAKGEYSVMPHSGADESASDKDDSIIEELTRPIYPFVDPGLGGIEIKNLTAHIFDAKYSLAGLQVRYVPRKDTREYAGWIKPEDKVYPFILSYAPYDDAKNVYPVRLAVSTGGDALIANALLDGDSHMPTKFSISGDIPDMGALGAVFNVDLTAVPSLHVDLDGKIAGTKIVLTESTLIVRDTELHLSGDYDWGKKKPTFNVILESRHVNLMRLVPELYYSKHKGHPDRELNVFKDIPLFGAEIFNMDMNLRLDIERLDVYRNLVLSDVDVRLKTHNGDARLDVHTGIAGGEGVVGADIEIAPDGTMSVAAAGVANNIIVGTILDQVDAANLISNLPMSVRFYLRGYGSDLSGLMATATGPIQIYSTGSGYAHSALVANMYGADFLTSLRHSIQDLFRSEKKYNQIKISCATISVKVRDGLIETENGVAIETSAINLRLAGDLDFGNETMHLALTTVPVRGLKLSLTGNVMNSIEITGNLAEPDIKISGAAVAGKVASATGIGLLLAPFTGGISLAAGAGIGLLAGDLLENWLADDTPCDTAMQRGAPNMRGDPEWMAAPIGELIKSVLDK